MRRIVFLDRATVQAPLATLSFPHEWREYDSTAPDETAERLHGADIAVSNKVRIGDGEMNSAPGLRLIVVAATGTNNIDLDAARRRGVQVANAPSYSVESVPEHVFMMALALRRNLLRYRADVAAGGWSRSPHFCLLDHPIRDIKDSEFGIIGYGTLGRAVARLAEAFGARVRVAERKGAGDVRPGREPFERVVAESDILTLHCPLTDETRGLIGEAELRAMKESAVLINCARGGVVDERALTDALKSNRIGGAGVDVLTEEPPRSPNPLLAEELPNLIVTPHHAWASRRAAAALAGQITEAIEGFVRGEAVNRVV